MSTAAEVVQLAARDGITFELTDSKLLLKGGTAEKRAELAPLVRPLAKAIAAMLRRGAAAPADKPRAHLVAIPPTAVPEASAAPAVTCTLGKRSPDPCPACRYTHGSLADLPACTDCGSTAWVISLVQDDGLGRRCVACVSEGPGGHGRWKRPARRKPRRLAKGCDRERGWRRDPGSDVRAHFGHRERPDRFIVNAGIGSS